MPTDNTVQNLIPNNQNYEVSQQNHITISKQSVGENDAFDIYHNAREAVHAYAIANDVGRRREISEPVAICLELFLKYDFKEIHKQYFLNSWHKYSKLFREQLTQESGLYQKLKMLDPVGASLLEISETIDLSELKSLYKIAAKKHHPDLGGSNEVMKKINEAYEIFFEAISCYVPNSEEISGNGRFSQIPKTWDDFIFSIYITLACIFGDDFAADKALFYLKKAYDIFIQSFSIYVGEAVGALIGIGGVIDRPCRVLGRFKMKVELSEAAKITSELIDLSYKYSVPNPFSINSRDCFPREKDLLREINVKLVITHLKQAENAYRLKIIDEKRFRNAIKKFEGKISLFSLIEKRIIEFQKQDGFFITDNEDSVDLNKIPNVIIGPSLSQDRFYSLSEEQKWEYNQIFNSKNAGKILEKYALVRANELLIQIINSPANGKYEKAVEEIEFIYAISHNGFGAYYLLKQFIVLLSGLERSIQEDKLGQLASMDRNEKLSASPADINTGQAPLRNGTNYGQRISVDWNYINYAIEFLYKPLKSNFASMCFPEHVKQMNRDLQKAYAVYNSKIGKLRNRIFLENGATSKDKDKSILISWLSELKDITNMICPENIGFLNIPFELNWIFELLNLSEYNAKSEMANWQFDFDSKCFWRGSSKKAKDKIIKRIRIEI